MPPSTARRWPPHLYGQELNAETYAICKADPLLKGEGAAADNIVGGTPVWGVAIRETGTLPSARDAKELSRGWDGGCRGSLTASAA